MIKIKITDKEKIDFLNDDMNDDIYHELRVDIKEITDGLLVTFKDEKRPDLWSFFGLKRAIEIYKNNYNTSSLFIDSQSTDEQKTCIKMECSKENLQELLDSVKMFDKYPYLHSKKISINFLDGNNEIFYSIDPASDNNRLDYKAFKSNTFYLQTISGDPNVSGLLTGILYSNSLDMGLKSKIIGSTNLQKTINLKKNVIEDFAGVNLKDQEIKNILLKKGYRVKIKDNKIEITNPIFRRSADQTTILDDLSNPLTKIHEPELINYLPKINLDKSKFKDFELKLKNIAVMLDYNEVLSNMVIEPHSLSGQTKFQLRGSLLTGLLDILKSNQRKKPVQIFEQGYTFDKDGTGKVKMAFLKNDDHVDINEMTNIIYSIMSSIGIGFELRPSRGKDRRFITGRHFDIYSYNVKCGQVAELHPEYLYNNRQNHPAIYGELDYEKIFNLTKKERLILKSCGRISGELHLSGSKNAALPIIFAASSLPTVTHLKNVPLQLEDIKRSIELIKSLGVDVEQLPKKKELIITGPIKEKKLEEDMTSKIRYSILLLSCLAAHFDEYIFPNKIGGCQIGDRKIDQHLFFLERMGFGVETDEQYININKKNTPKSDIEFSVCSTGATENALIYCAHDTETHNIFNAHLRPEILDVIRFLKNAGVQVKTDKDKKMITTKGPTKFPDRIEHTIMGDIDEGFAYLVATQLTGGDIRIYHIPVDYMNNLLRLLSDIGFNIKQEENTITLKAVRSDKMKKFEVTTGPFPEIGSDQVPILTALAAFIDGRSVIKDTRFPNRIKFLKELKKLGVKVEFKNKKIIIQGNSNLVVRGNSVSATDIRGGMSVILTALSAKNLVSIDNIYQINRGYENINKKLQELGINIHSINSYLI